jgi:ankyrin repeat protein
MKVSVKLLAVALTFFISLSSLADAKPSQTALSRCPEDNAAHQIDYSTPESNKKSIERILKKQKAPAVVYALGKDQRSNLKTILRDKPNLNICVLGASLLTLSVAMGDDELAALLLEHGAKPDEPKTSFGSTPYMDALSMGKYAMASLILNHGANPLANSDGGTTALHELARGQVLAGAPESMQEQIKIAEFLLAKGVKLDAPGPQGSRALAMAAISKKFELAEFFIQRGADVNMQNNKRKTALHFASGANGNVDMVKLLLSHGANPLLLDAGGLSALDVARRAGRSDIAQAIEDFKK